MSKCLTTIQLLRAMVEPMAPENATIMAHLYICDKCLNTLKEWQEGIEQAEYFPQPDDDKAAANAIRNVMEQVKFWKRFYNKCRHFFSQFKEFENFCAPQIAYGGTHRKTTKIKEVTTPLVIHFDSITENRKYEWHATMTFPIPDTPEYPNIYINIDFPVLPPEEAIPQYLHLYGIELPLENGITHISCKDFWNSAQRNKGEIYVEFRLNNGTHEPIPISGIPKL